MVGIYNAVFIPSFLSELHGFFCNEMTVFIVLVWPTGTVLDNAIARLVDIALGGVVAFICAYIILPSRVSVNLPDQLSRTIKANIEYAKLVLVTSPTEQNTKNVSKSFKNYIMEENNLEAGVKKLEDTFRDINDDLELYQEIIASNNKMAADLSGITAILNNNRKTLVDLNIDVHKIKKTLHNVENSLTDDIKPSRLSMDNILLDYTDNNESKDLEQIISWIISDLGMMHKDINIAKETGLLQMYTKLT